MASSLQLHRDGAVARLSLDEIAWNGGMHRKPLDESRTLLLAFIQTHRHWVIEGCYGDLIETAQQRAVTMGLQLLDQNLARQRRAGFSNRCQKR